MRYIVENDKNMPISFLKFRYFSQADLISKQNFLKALGRSGSVFSCEKTS